ncbi:MAG: peptidase M3 [Bacteroidaceae bacterium]|nr:peptidase M3 [Bacteroidaceae bacterium]
MNILLEPTFHTLHGTAPFSQIKLEDYEPAILEAMKQEDEAVETIIKNPEPPTFLNTIAPRTGELLERVTSIFFNLVNADTSDEMDELAQKLSPMLTEHYARIMHNEKLFERVKQIWENPGELNDEQRKLLSDTYDAFVRGGALLSKEDKEKFAAIETELGQLGLQFSQNELKQTNDYELHVTNPDELAGLPDTAKDAAALAAKEKGKEGWLFTLHAPSYGPFLTYADNRELRRQMYLAKNTLCCKGDAYDNREIVRKIVNLRLELAKLLGYKCFADYALKDRMAKTTGHVNELIEKLYAAYMPVAKEEVKTLTATPIPSKGGGNGDAGGQFTPPLEGTGEAWDFAYYSHKEQLRKYNIDSEMLRPYFQLQKVKDGIFGLATRLYGITFRLQPDIEVYHPDVEAYEVFDADGSFLAVLYADFFPRVSKQSGAWMTDFSEQFVDEAGTDHRPHVSIVMNLTKPTEEKPSLLTLSEVETFLHEFGHALHSIFSKVHYKAQSGTNVLRDFVELPSQLMENFAVEPEFLHTFANHYETGEPLPDELIERIRQSRNFHCGYACIRQLSFCMLDMAYHTLTEPLTEDILDFESKAWSRTQLLPAVPDTNMSVQFSHIMSGGYAAGYYSYKWAEVLDADAFSLFLEKGIFDKETASRFRREILSKGGTADPMRLYVNFRGKEPDIQALLKRNGIASDKQRALDLRYLRMARIWSENSYCQRRQVGALVVKDKMIISDGYNGTPSGFENICEENGVTKPYVLHAEANAITKIARSGNNSDGSTLYVTDSPCIECAKLIIQAGIKRVIYSREYRLTDGVDLLRRAGIEVKYIKD